MANFALFNIQLLPNASDIEEVGVSGYKKLMSLLRDENKKWIDEGVHENYHYSLSSETFSGPFKFNFERELVTGFFLRYTKTDDITSLKNGKRLLKKDTQKSAITKRREIPFLFDTKRHIFAIDLSNGLLGNCKSIKKMLDLLLSDIAKEFFPNHSLTINIISRPIALEDVFENAIRYKNISLKLTHPNGESEGLLDELKESNIHKLNVHASGGKGDITSLPNFLKTMLLAAQIYGTIHLSYVVYMGDKIDNKTKVVTYDSEDSPYTFIVKRAPSDSDDKAYLKRAGSKLKKLDITSSEKNGQKNENIH